MSETTSEIELSPRGNVAYLPSVGATVFMDGLPAFAAGPGGGLIQSGTGIPSPGSGPTNPNTRREWIPGDEEIVFWGMGNDYPQIVRDRFSKNPIIAETLEKKAAFWLGGGVYAATDRLSEEEIDDAEINQFLNSIATQRYLEESLLDLAWYANAWPELILSKDRKKIAQIHNNETAYGRWGRNLDKVYLNANWPNAKATDEDTVVLPCVDPYRWDLVDFIRNGRAYKYAYPLSKPSVGRTFYQLANTDSIISSGWLDVLEAIPLFKKYALKNQMSLLYHVEVSAEYWAKVYGERWEKATFEQKMAIRDEFLSDLMKKLTNIQNAHSSVMTDFWYDDDEGKEHGVRIHELKGTKVDGKYSEDYSDGSKQVHYAMGVDQVLTGFTDSDQASQSGGSNKREAFWIFLTLSNLTRRKVLELLNLVADYNGWRQRYPKLTFKFRDTLLTTLDTGHSTAKTSTPTA